jgi:hypothetical protein
MSSALSLVSNITFDNLCLNFSTVISRLDIALLVLRLQYTT